MTQEKISRKITVLSFLAMVSVVYIHHNAIGTFEPAQWNAIIQGLLTRGISDWAVPFFFMVSGFWFARSSYVQENGGGYRKLILRKIKTLLTPYLIWSVIGAILVMPLIVFNNHVNHLPIWNRTLFGASGLFGKANYLIGITSNGPAGNLALWYVRTLLIFFVLAPIWKVLYRLSRYLLVAAGLSLVLIAPDTWIPTTGLKTGSFGWLFLGMGLSYEIAANVKLPRLVAGGCGILWVGFALLKSTGMSFFPQLIPLFGILFMWSISDWQISVRPSWMKQTFWVYCLHGMLAEYFVGGGSYIFGKNDSTSLLLMLVAPWTNIAVCLIAAAMMKKVAPHLLEVLSGGRT